MLSTRRSMPPTKTDRGAGRPTSRSVTDSAATVGAVSAPFGRILPWLLLVGGLIGTAAAFVLSVERMELLANPAYVPSCSINPVLSCGSVMVTEQAELFGFANSLLGLAGFPVVAATGAALLAGARLADWYWRGLQVGVTAALAFVVWLAFQSLYRIGALCPYCMVVWAVVLPLFWYVTLTNAARGRLGSRLGRSPAVRALVGQHGVLLTVGYLLVVGLIGHRFWDYWVSLA